MDTGKKDDGVVTLHLSRAEYEDLMNCLSEHRDIMTFVIMLNSVAHEQGRDLFSEMTEAVNAIMAGRTP